MELEKKWERAILVGVNTNDKDILKNSTESTIAELAELAETAGAETAAWVLQNKSEIDVATYVGQGKLEEIKELIDANEPIDLLIFDDDLSPSQVRNIEEETDVTVIDRSRLILDIFAQHANSSAGKCQVELAQLKYMLPRLSGLGKSLSRLGGGIGTRGPGETKLESDRRHIQTRISKLQRDLKEIAKHNDTVRKAREKSNIPKIALVGYTNVGKSTLLNLLTDAGTLAENKLFATLDPLVRQCDLGDNTEVLFIDTVGFIRKLPHHLVEAFKSTLEEVTYCDMILHVVDASSPEYLTQMQVVDGLLKELKADGKPTVTVFNKMDQAAGDIPKKGDSVYISAKTGFHLNELITTIKNKINERRITLKLLIPFNEGAALSKIHQVCNVLNEEYSENGTKLTISCDSSSYRIAEPFICGHV